MLPDKGLSAVAQSGEISRQTSPNHNQDTIGSQQYKYSHDISLSKAFICPISDGMLPVKVLSAVAQSREVSRETSPNYNQDTIESQQYEYLPK